ncbi:MAG: hypothetical protein ACI8QS_000676 [Planctomycetota bacterium]|jgi:hypothetical protein
MSFGAAADADAAGSVLHLLHSLRRAKFAEGVIRVPSRWVTQARWAGAAFGLSRRARAFRSRIC